VNNITFSGPVNFWTHYRASRAVIARLWTTYVAWVFFVGLPFALLIFLLATHRDVTERGAFGLPAWMLPVIGFLFMALVMPLTTMLNVYSMRRRNPSLGNQTWVLTPEQYSVSGPLFNTVMKWDAFIKAREARGSFYCTFHRAGHSSSQNQPSARATSCVRFGRSSNRSLVPKHT